LSQIDCFLSFLREIVFPEKFSGLGAVAFREHFVTIFAVFLGEIL